MAKKSLIAKEVKRKKISSKYFDKRNILKSIVKSKRNSQEEKASAIVMLQKLPKDSATIRIRNRCSLTGRPHGFYRKFGLGRNKLREAVMRGDVPGVTKASW